MGRSGRFQSSFRTRLLLLIYAVSISLAIVLAVQPSRADGTIGKGCAEPPVIANPCIRFEANSAENAGEDTGFGAPAQKAQSGNFLYHEGFGGPTGTSENWTDMEGDEKVRILNLARGCGMNGDLNAIRAEWLGPRGLNCILDDVSRRTKGMASGVFEIDNITWWAKQSGQSEVALYKTIAAEMAKRKSCLGIAVKNLEGELGTLKSFAASAEPHAKYISRMSIQEKEGSPNSSEKDGDWQHYVSGKTSDYKLTCSGVDNTQVAGTNGVPAASGSSPRALPLYGDNLFQSKGREVVRDEPLITNKSQPIQRKSKTDGRR